MGCSVLRRISGYVVFRGGRGERLIDPSSTGSRIGDGGREATEGSMCTYFKHRFGAGRLTLSSYLKLKTKLARGAIATDFSSRREAFGNILLQGLLHLGKGGKSTSWGSRGRRQRLLLLLSLRSSLSLDSAAERIKLNSASRGRSELLCRLLGRHIPVTRRIEGF